MDLWICGSVDLGQPPFPAVVHSTHAGLFAFRHSSLTSLPRPATLLSSSRTDTGLCAFHRSPFKSSPLSSPPAPTGLFALHQSPFPTPQFALLYTGLFAFRHSPLPLHLPRSPLPLPTPVLFAVHHSPLPLNHLFADPLHGSPGNSTRCVV